MKRKTMFILFPTLFILIGLFFAIFFNIPRMTYTYSDQYDGYLVYKVYGNSEEYIVPKTYRGKNIVGVSTRAFYKHSKLKRVIFKEEENIEYIGRLAFSECKNLEEVNISYAREISKNAFSYDVSLKAITLSAEYIGGSAFYKCSALEDVTLNHGVLSIGSYAFSQCKSLECLYLPNTIENVYEHCFNYSGLKELYAPEYLKEDSYLKTLDYVIYY